MSSSSAASSSTSTVPTVTGTGTATLPPTSTPTAVANTTLFNPPPTDNLNHCKCGPQESCFMYPGGFICQPFTSNNISNAPGIPSSWFLADNYPSIRYTMPVANQTAGANCTTITTPPSRYYQALAYHIMKYDMGSFIQDIDSDYSSTLFQYRGNCADSFYCRPNSLPAPQPGFVDEFIQGNLPGTCQPLVAEGGDCLASSMCQGWHVSSSFTYNNDQFRCKMNTKMGNPNHPAGICYKLRTGSGTVDFSDNGFNQQTTRTYILSAMLVFCLAFLYLWYRRQKRRHMQQQMMMLDAEGQPYYYDNTAAYLQRGGGGVNRRPDENDGELPAYGQHRRDERVTGPAAEEIGMYSFPSGAPPPASPNPAYPIASRPTQHTYPYSLNHPAFASTSSPVPTGPLYPPPQSPPPPPLSASEAEAAALSAAAAAVAMPVPEPEAPVDARRVVAEGGLLPPSYDSAASHPTGEEKEESKKKKERGEGDEGTNPFEGSSAGSSRSTPDLERPKEKASQDDHDSTRSGGSSSSDPARRD